MSPGDLPIGGLGSDVYDYIEPGRQKLTGFQTQWYARARDGSDDYSRMARQKCVMAAMLDQLEPTDVLKNFQKIAKASSAMVSTSIPASEVDRFIGLAWEQALAQRGFVVWQVDNRGSWGRGHKFESAVFRNLGERELADQVIPLWDAACERLQKIIAYDDSREHYSIE